MPVTKSAIKAMKQNRKANERNKEVKNDFRVKVKAAKKSVTSDSKKLTAEVTKAIQALDKAAKNNVIHKNAAARRKSRLVKTLNAVVGKPTDLVTVKMKTEKPAKTATKAKKVAPSKKTTKK